MHHGGLLVDTIQKSFDSIILKHTKQKWIRTTVDIIRAKAKRAGYELTKSQTSRLRRLFDRGEVSSIRLRFSSTGTPKVFNIRFTKKDINKIRAREKAILKSIKPYINQFSASYARALLAELKTDWPNRQRQARKMTRGFERRLYDGWRLALELLEMHIIIVQELVLTINARYHKSTSIKTPHLVEVISRLSARACQVSLEIMTLLRGGFADGAMARWRTLHEITVTAFFISKHGNTMAERYLCYDVVESHRGARQYQVHCGALGYEPFPENQMQQIRDAFDKVIERFGKPFSESYGWASSVFSDRRINFSDIEQCTDLDHFRPFYKLASQNVHADPKGVLSRLGHTDRNMMLAGPSKFGLADPGHSTAISLLQITSCLLFLEPNLDRMVMAQVLKLLSDEVGTAFINIHNNIEALRS